MNFPSPPVPCSAEDDSGRGAGDSHPTIVASIIMVSPGSQLLVDLPVLLPE